MQNTTKNIVRPCHEGPQYADGTADDNFDMGFDFEVTSRPIPKATPCAKCGNKVSGTALVWWTISKEGYSHNHCSKVCYDLCDVRAQEHKCECTNHGGYHMNISEARAFNCKMLFPGVHASKWNECADTDEEDEE
jgi:hypothetical protein